MIEKTAQHSATFNDKLMPNETIPYIEEYRNLILRGAIVQQAFIRRAAHNV
ncbi:hypothetical protein JYU12_00960 [bacterium AH-315-K03]|nr:hypothetical protein [bacterium AH-315-K03]